MASLRTTRRLSYPSAQLRDPYHSLVSEIVTPSSASKADHGGVSKVNSEGRTKNVRKVKSNVTVGSSHFAVEHEFEPRDYSDRVEDKVSGVESRGRTKGTRKGARSQSARPRDLDDVEENHTRHGPSMLQAPGSNHRTSSVYTQSSAFLASKSTGDSRCRSSSPMFSSSPPPRTHPDEYSPSDESDNPSLGRRPKPKGRSHRVSRSKSRDAVQDAASQKAQRPSRLRAPTSHAASLPPPPTPTLNLPGDDFGLSTQSSSRDPSTAIQLHPSMSSLPSHFREDNLSRLPSNAKPKPRNPRSSPSPALPPPASIAAPRTLKDVTRRLEQNHKLLRDKDSSQSESDIHRGNLSQEPSLSAITSRSHDGSYAKANFSTSFAGVDAIQQLSAEHLQEAYPKPKLGLALTSEGGHPLGERSTELIRPLLPSRRATTAELSSRPSTLVSKNFSKPMRTQITSSSESLTNSNDQPSERNTAGISSKMASVVRVRKSRDAEGVAARVSTMTTEGAIDQGVGSIVRERSLSRSPLPEPIAKQERRQVPGYHEKPSDNRSRATPRRQNSSPAPAHASSSHSSLPRPSTKPALVHRQSSSPARSTFPSLPSPRPSRTTTSFSHKLSGSDSSVYSLPRLKKLVICNPDPNDRPSPSSSSNPETPISTAATAASQDFTILALSSSQASVGGNVHEGDYIVPDEVAAEIADDERRRLKALAGLVHGLDMGNVNQRPTDDSVEIRHNHHLQATPKARWGTRRRPEEVDDEDDDVFFSRLSMHDDDDSLLEEPEPEPEAGFGEEDDEDEFDEERSEESDEEKPPLPPTPKFVYPLEEGEDLESRITRVTSLHRISTVSSASPPRRPEQDHHIRARPEIPNQWTHYNAEREPDRTSRQMSPRWDFHAGTPEQQHTDTHLKISQAREAGDSVPSKFVDGGGVISNSQSQGSNLTTDNELSSVGNGRLLDAASGTEGTLSSGAEALFRQLQVEAEAREANDGSRGQDAGSDSHSGSGRQVLHDEERSNSRGRDQSLGHKNTPTVKPPGAISLRTWRSTLPFGAYDSLAERHGPSEMRRQEIIWELCETEQAFVKSLRLILRLFVQPLRQEDRTWIPGVPRDVTRLFDWFDDIMHLHSQISSALHAARSAQYPVVIQIAETLRPFVPRLEVHQPYLVRLESVSSAVEAMSKDAHSDFGEFVRIQTASPECESMNLPSFLLKPVQRLMKYPLFFKQLWELTPRNHSDHLPTFSLLHSTDMIIRVMQEVKTREEEYELVKNLASRIKGLPVGFQLARRERRLVAQGLLRRVVLSDKERILLDSTASIREPCSPQGASLSRIGSTSSNSSSFAGDWSYHPAGTGNVAGSEIGRNLHAESTASDGLDGGSGVSRSASGRSRSSSLRGSLRHKSRESLVYAFVFTDLMILTTPVSERLHLLRGPKNAGEGKETWKLIEDIGVSRVLGVTDQSDQLASYGHLIAVELMSMTPNLLDSSTFSDGTAAIPVYLGIPDQKPPASDDALEVFEEAKAKWLDAFERCFRFTLRSLSFPSYARNNAANDGNTDLDLDTKSSVMSILSSGLPLPMSPSQQLSEAQKGRPADLVQEEREERGWWSLRFQQVLKEVQRSSRSPVLDATPSRKSDTRSKPQGGRRSETRPLILSPNTQETHTRKGGLLSLGRKKSR